MGTYISLSLPVLFLAAVVQSTFMPQIRVFGGTPDLVLLLVLSWCANRNLNEGLTWAFVGGILQDLLSAAPTGTSALGMIPTIYIIFLLNRQFYRVGLPLALLLFLVGTLIKEVLAALVMTAAGFGGDVIMLFSYVILPTAAYNVAVGAFVYVVVRLVQRWLQPGARVTRS